MHEYVEWRRVIEREMRAQHKALGGRHQTAIARKTADRPAVLRVMLRPSRQHLPRTDGIELLDIVKQQDPDMAWRSASSISAHIVSVPRSTHARNR